jgi:hypothetical protein
MPGTEDEGEPAHVDAREAAHHLGVSSTTVRRLIRNNQLPAQQVVPCAPWEIAVDALGTETVRQAIRDIKRRVASPRTPTVTDQPSMFTEE